MTSKEQIRRDHRARRRELDPARMSAAGESIAVHGASWAAARSQAVGQVFAVYLSVGSEPPTLPLIRALHEAGHRILLPVCEPGHRLSWVYWSPQTLFVRSAYAPIDEPVGERLAAFPAEDAAGIFLPATAVDGSGNRVGQGGGYYDRFLAELEAGGRRPPVVAVVHEFEVLPAGAIPAEPFDRPVDGVLTPMGFTAL